MDTFECFRLQRDTDLKRIARATRGEHQYGDVVNEAWLMADALSSRYAVLKDFLDAGFQDLLLRHLYQSLVRYTELNVRHAVRLDHGSGEDSENGASHPLMNLLSSDEGRDPLSHLIAREDIADQTPAEEEHPSLAGAWIALLRHYGNRMRPVADHLLISVSYAYRCCAKASWIVTQQNAIPLRPPTGTESQFGPWRRHRVVRNPRQLEFDFEEKLPI